MTWAFRLLQAVAGADPMVAGLGPYLSGYKAAEALLDLVDDSAAREIALALATLPRFFLLDMLARSPCGLELVALDFAWKASPS